MSTTNIQESIEAVGNKYDPEKMMTARQMTRSAIYQIAEAVKPGMVEEDAVEMAKDMLADLGLLRGWHDVFVRFGVNTTKTYGAASEPGVVLGTDDIFFVDIGPVWKEWEGDGGETFLTGSAPEKARCAQDTKEIFEEVRQCWLKTAATGKELYEFAVAATERRGWVLDMDLSGHRLADFPHATIYEGSMARVDFRPSNLLWVLEIHIRSADNTFGAFFEDILLEDE
jgi:Xaa-Pro aminopeptidase